MWNYRCEIYTEAIARVIHYVWSDVELTREQVREKLRDEFGSDVEIFTIDYD